MDLRRGWVPTARWGPYRMLQNKQTNKIMEETKAQRAQREGLGEEAALGEYRFLSCIF